MTTITKAITFRASSIGDGLMAKYLLENIHAQFPLARCGIVVASRGSMIRDLFSAYPWIEIIEANRRSPKALFSLIARFWGSDLVVTQYAGKHGGSFGLASKLVARLLAKHGGLIGFSDSWRWNEFIYSSLLPVRREEAVAEHEREVLRAAGLTVVLPYPTLSCIEDEAVLTKFYLKAGQYLLVHVFAGNKGRSLSPEKGRELLASLHAKYPHLQLVVTGGDGDREAALAIAHDMPATVIAGDTSLQDMMNLIRGSSGVVSVDTGIAHMTAQMKKPLVVLRTCLGPNWWLPEQYGKDVPLVVCANDAVCASGHIAKDYPDCINGISPSAVARNLSSLV